MTHHEIICQIGEAKLGKGDGVLRATLGSCIGIGLIWRQEGKCALAHCLLSVAPNRSFEISAKYISQAIPSLLLLLKASRKSFHELEAIVVGGAHMIGNPQANRLKSIGTMNSDAAIKYLKDLGIKIIHLDIGGDAGRQVSINCKTFEYVVRKINKFEEGLSK